MHVKKNVGGLLVKHWPVDQEVMGSNPTHGRHYFCSTLCVRFPGLLCPIGKVSTGSVTAVLHRAGTWEFLYENDCSTLLSKVLIPITSYLI